MYPCNITPRGQVVGIKELHLLQTKGAAPTEVKVQILQLHRGERSCARDKNSVITFAKAFLGAGWTLGIVPGFTALTKLRNKHQTRWPSSRSLIGENQIRGKQWAHLQSTTPSSSASKKSSPTSSPITFSIQLRARS